MQRRKLGFSLPIHLPRFSPPQHLLSNRFRLSLNPLASVETSVVDVRQRPLLLSQALTFGKFTDEPMTEGYIFTTLKRMILTQHRVPALDIDSELLAYAELPAQERSGHVSQVLMY